MVDWWNSGQIGICSNHIQVRQRCCFDLIDEVCGGGSGRNAERDDNENVKEDGNENARDPPEETTKGNDWKYGYASDPDGWSVGRE
ncbi:hypothetical protein GALMADRAFT_225684 [Galerina marginata CBS 339.88]|uniref:Uncharacterized protein n=1 Tax=Galerina marginata (strain CBS 339.88) TaxID=685588 RepID=A0A067TA72_GALM3|nr:hypothetical protein GALMADRAFT_225684 [Galerina marginata CBS 339.88]